ncbi:MAG: response regulator [Sulfurospirillum sp.]
MDEKNNYKKLASLAKEFTLLYVEDNTGLQKQAGKIFHKFFGKVIVAKDGLEGLAFFREHCPDIVVTDIKMPKMDGLEMSKKIKELDIDAKIIITSAFDEKDNLLQSIDIGIAKYLKKPIPVEALIEALIEIIEQIKNKKDKNLFENYTQDIFHNQDNLLILIKNDKVLIANNKCLDFFAQENSKSFKKFFKKFSKLLLPHENFLYDKDGINWLDVVKEHLGKLFSVKIKDKDGKNRHFVLKATKIPQKEDYFILSFDDITELNLLKEYDPGLSKEERISEEKIRMINLLHVLKRNKSQIRLYNSYKGLSITNTGTIEEVMQDHINVKTTYLQQRAIHIEKKTTIESELFSQALNCELDSVNFETQIVVLKNFVFNDHLPSEQKHTRVMPEESSKIELLFNAKKLSSEINILDISVDGCNLTCKAIPAGFKEGSKIVLKMVLGAEKKAINLRINAKILKLQERKDEFGVVVVFELEAELRKLLIDYIAKRQMALIREFKGLQNE